MLSSLWLEEHPDFQARDEETNMPSDLKKPSELHQVTLPVDKSHFQDFIKGLLGRPQALIKRIHGSFELGRAQLRQIDDLLQQRIQQQNSGCLVQFEARLGLSDDQVVIFNTLEDLLTYNVPRRVTSSTLDISWDYLVKFSDKENPEKQRIQLKVRAHYNAASAEGEDIYYPAQARLGLLFDQPLLLFRIEYTARTWGDDIESMLSRYLHSITCRPAGLPRFMMLHEEKIGLSIALLFYASIIYGCFQATWRFSQFNLSRVQAVVNETSVADLSVIRRELNLLLTLHAEGAWASHILTICVILVLAIPLTVFLAIWTSEVSYTPKPSFILLTAEDEDARITALRKHSRRTFWYIFSILVNIGAGIAANLLFRAYF